jgi:hypothetical protein
VLLLPSPLHVLSTTNSPSSSSHVSHISKLYATEAQELSRARDGVSRKLGERGRRGKLWGKVKGRGCVFGSSPKQLEQPHPELAHRWLLVHSSHSWRLERALRATLDAGPRSRDQWIQAILLVKSFKLVRRPLDEGPRPKSDKLNLKPTWHLFWTENQLVWTKKTVPKGKLLIWRMKNQAREQSTVELKDSICFTSPNWF